MKLIKIGIITSLLAFSLILGLAGKTEARRLVFSRDEIGASIVKPWVYSYTYIYTRPRRPKVMQNNGHRFTLPSYQEFRDGVE